MCLKVKTPIGAEIKEKQMSNVVDFPCEPKAANLENQIIMLQMDIVDRFDRLTEHFIQSKMLEQECSELQYRYDNLILQYSRTVGSENIPAGLLEHCSGVVATYNEAEDEIKLTFDEETVVENQAPVEPDIQAVLDTITKYFGKQLDELQ